SVRSTAVYRGLTSIPSGVAHTRVSGSAPLRSSDASARQSSRVGFSPGSVTVAMVRTGWAAHETVRPRVHDDRTGRAGLCPVDRNTFQGDSDTVSTDRTAGGALRVAATNASRDMFRRRVRRPG